MNHHSPPPDPWFYSPAGPPAPRLRLFCFGYAGSSAHIFHGWPRGLPATVEVVAAQLPGRGARYHEPLFTAIEPLVAALAAAIQPRLDRPFALFGHSMGALVAFELARALQRRERPPVHLFVSAFRAPHLPPLLPPMHPLVGDAFVAELQRRHGTRDSALADPEFRALALPSLHADIAALETHVHVPAAPLSAPLTAFGGLDDHGVPPEQLACWAEHTRGRFEQVMLPGDHFFMHGQQAALLARISQALAA